MKIPLIRRISVFALGVLLVFFVLSFVYAHLTETFSSFPLLVFVLGMAVALGCGVLLAVRAHKSGDYLTSLHERLYLVVSALFCVAASLVLLFAVLPGVRLGFWGTVLFGYAPLAASLIYLIAAAIRFKEAGELPKEYPEYTEKQQAQRVGAARREWIVGTVAAATAAICLYVVIPDELPLVEVDDTVPRPPTGHLPEFLEENWGSLTYLSRAAAAGIPEAQYRLAMVYFDEDHPQYWNDPARALEYFQRAADQGHVGAKLNLGYIHRDGYGTDIDAAKSFAFFQGAAESGDPTAAMEVARAYLRGRGVDANEETAYQHFLIAAESGIAEAQNELAQLYQRGIGVSADPDSAFHWFSLASRAGNPAAQNDLALMYLRGRVVEQDVEEGLRWMTLSAEQDFQAAVFNLGLVYYTGNYVPVDYDLSYRYLSRLADSGHVLGHFYLGSLYYEGRGVARDFEMAYDQFKAAAERGNLLAAMNVGGLYLEGLGTERDLEKGLAYIERAAERGLAEAQWRMGRIYLEGRFVISDPIEALKWLLLAADQGHERAEAMSVALSEQLTDSDRQMARTLATRAVMR